MPSQAIRSTGLATWLHSDAVKTSHWNDRAIRIHPGNALAEWKEWPVNFVHGSLLFPSFPTIPLGSVLNIKGTRSAIKTDPLLLLHFSCPKQDQLRQVPPLLSEVIHKP
jgi:hypothetical protein